MAKVKSPVTAKELQCISVVCKPPQIEVKKLLTPTQARVIDALAQYAPKEAQMRLGIGGSTIRTHLDKAAASFGVEGLDKTRRSVLFRLALHTGQVSLRGIQTATAGDDVIGNISARQIREVHLLGVGVPPSHVGRELHISTGMIGTDLKHVYRELDVHSLHHATRRLYEIGVFQVSPSPAPPPELAAAFV